MPRRRTFGYVYRRRYPPGKGGGAAYRPGWYVRIRRKGRQIRRYAGSDRKTALEVLEHLRIQEERRELLGEAPPNEITLARFVRDTYFPHIERHLTPAGEDRRRGILSSAILPALGPLKLQDVAPHDIQALTATKPNLGLRRAHCEGPFSLRPVVAALQGQPGRASGRSLTTGVQFTPPERGG